MVQGKVVPAPMHHSIIEVWDLTDNFITSEIVFIDSLF
jgi:hypothetical protein